MIDAEGLLAENIVGSGPLDSYTFVQLTKAVALAASIGLVVGIILAKLYAVLISYLFGRGHLQGHSEERFNAYWVRTTFGKTRLVLYGTGTDSNRPFVVLIHGYAGSLDVFADPTRSNYCETLFHEGYDVLAFDLFGHGGSDSPETRYSAELFAAQLAEICLLLNLRKPFDIIAHSMGSSVAATFAYNYPDYVSRLIFICPSIVDKPMELRLRIALRIPFFSEILSYFIIPTFGEGTNDNNAGLLRACFRLLMTRLYNGGSWNAGEKTAFRMLQELASTKFSSSDSMFVLWGVDDKVIPFNHALDIARIAPHAKFAALKQADHMSFADGEEWMKKFFITHILNFLRKTSQATTISEYFERKKDEDSSGEEATGYRPLV